MKKIAKYIIIVVSITIIIGSIFIGISFVKKNSSEENKILLEKVNQEFKYIDNKISNLIIILGDNENNLNKDDILSQNTQEIPSSDTKKKEIDWNYLESELEEILKSWNIMLIDLNTLSDNKDIILEFSDLIDETLINCKNKNEKDTLKSLVKLYEVLVSNIDDFISNKQELNYIKIKSFIFNIYYELNIEDWGEIYKKLNEIENIFNKNIEEEDYINDQRLYILIKELNKSVNEKDKDLCYIKTSFIIEELKNNI